MRGYLIILFAFLIHQKSLGQDLTLMDKLEYAFQSDILLDAIIDSAMAYSPDAQRLDHGISFAENISKIENNAIFNALSLRAGYLYGTNLANISNGNGIDPTNNFVVNTQTGFYNAGVALQLPLDLILNRKHSIKLGEARVNMAKADKQKSELYVKQQVIDLYMTAKMNFGLQKNSALSAETSTISIAMAEKQFLNGQIDLGEFSRLQELHGKLLNEKQTYMGRYQNAILQLEALAGIKFHEMLNAIK